MGICRTTRELKPGLCNSLEGCGGREEGGKSKGKGTGVYLELIHAGVWASLVAQLVKNPPAMWETHVRSLGQEDLLQKGTATHSSILTWIIRYSPWGCNMVTQLSNIHFHGRNQHNIVNQLSFN